MLTDAHKRYIAARMKEYYSPTTLDRPVDEEAREVLQDVLEIPWYDLYPSKLKRLFQEPKAIATASSLDWSMTRVNEVRVEMLRSIKQTLQGFAQGKELPREWDKEKLIEVVDKKFSKDLSDYMAEIRPIIPPREVVRRPQPLPRQVVPAENRELEHSLVQIAYYDRIRNRLHRKVAGAVIFSMFVIDCALVWPFLRRPHSGIMPLGVAAGLVLVMRSFLAGLSPSLKGWPGAPALSQGRGNAASDYTLYNWVTILGFCSTLLAGAEKILEGVSVGLGLLAGISNPHAASILTEALKIGVVVAADRWIIPRIREWDRECRRVSREHERATNILDSFRLEKEARMQALLLRDLTLNGINRTCPPIVKELAQEVSNVILPPPVLSEQIYITLLRSEARSLGCLSAIATRA